MAKKQPKEEHSSSITSTYQKWLIRHRRTMVITALIAPAFELLSMELFDISEATAAVNLHVNSWLFFVFNFFSLLICAAACLLTRGEHAATSRGQHIVSFSFAAICLILYFAAGAFTAMCAVLFLALLMTTIYGDISLTNKTFLFILGCFVAGKLWAEESTLSTLWLTNPKTAINLLFTLLMLLGFYFISLSIIRFEHARMLESCENERLYRALLHENAIDALTGLQNRRALRAALESIDTLPRPCFFMMCDLNDFKKLNDTYGHQVGDECLRIFARILRKNCDPHTTFRYGGDEFCALFCGASRYQVAQACVGVERELAALNNPHIQHDAICACFGVAKLTPNMTASDWIHQADAALYEAKQHKHEAGSHIQYASDTVTAPARAPIET
jgi:diguanylate cyclase